MDTLITFSIFISSFVIYYAILANSTEILSLSFALIGIAMVAKKSPLSGLFFGIAGLSKYMALILLPLIFLLHKPKKIAIALVLFVIPMLPWFYINKVAFGSYIFSYSDALSIVSASIFTQGISLQALANICANAIIFSVAALLIVLSRQLGSKGGASTKLLSSLRKWLSIKNDYTVLLLAFIALSAVSYFYVAYRRDVFAQARFGYMLYGALSLCVASALSAISRKTSRDYTPLVIGALGTVVLLFSILHVGGLLSYTPALSIWNPVYSNAVQTLDRLGYGNCNIVSNDWVYMLYLGVHAFSPFYGNPAAYNYPILVFYNSTAATSVSAIKSIEGSQVAYSSNSFAILLPQNVTCITPAPAAAK